MIRIGIVDDHPVVLDGLVAALTREAGIEVAWSATNIADAVRALETARCDVVLVDIRLPDGSGLDLVTKASPGRPAFVVLSSFDRPQYARAAFQRGAACFLLKTAPMKDVVAALRIAALGGTIFPPEHLAGQAASRSLTAREHEIVRLVAGGYSNDEIAGRLSLSRKTVEAYLTRMFERWAVSTRTELALRAEREGWLDPAPDGPRH